MIGYSHRFEMVNGWSCSFSISIHKLHEQLCTKRQLEFGFAKWILKGLSTRVWSVHGCQQFRGLGRGKEYSDGFSMPTPCHFQRKHRDSDDIRGLRLFSDTIVIVFNDQQDWWLPFGFMKYKRFINFIYKVELLRVYTPELHVWKSDWEDWISIFAASKLKRKIKKEKKSISIVLDRNDKHY